MKRNGLPFVAREFRHRRLNSCSIGPRVVSYDTKAGANQQQFVAPISHPSNSSLFPTSNPTPHLPFSISFAPFQSLYSPSSPSYPQPLSSSTPFFHHFIPLSHSLISYSQSTHLLYHFFPVLQPHCNTYLLWFFFPLSLFYPVISSHHYPPFLHLFLPLLIPLPSL